MKYDWDRIGSKPFQMTFWQNEPKENRFDDWYKEFKSGNKNREDHDELYDKNSWSSIAYHLDANLANKVVKKYCKNVNHIIETLTELPKGYDYMLMQLVFADNLQRIELKLHGIII